MSKKFVTLYLFSLPVFLILDGIWLGLIASDLYGNALAHLLGPVNWIAAAIFYPVFLIGLTYFAATQTTSIKEALKRGALFGFFTYLTYDMTNLATLKDWPLHVSLIDIAWGTFVCGAVSAAATFLYTRSRK